MWPKLIEWFPQELQGVSSASFTHLLRTNLNWYDDLVEECKEVHRHIARKHKAYYKAACIKSALKKKNNGYGSLFSIAVSEIENACLMAMLRRLVELDIVEMHSSGAYMYVFLKFDGLVVRADKIVGSVDDLLRDLELAIKNDTGLVMRLVPKSMERADIPPPPMYGDTCIAGNVVHWGRGIRKLRCGSIEMLTDVRGACIRFLDAEKRFVFAKSSEKADAMVEMCQTREVAANMLNEYIAVIAGGEILIPVTNKRNVITRWASTCAREMKDAVGSYDVLVTALRSISRAKPDMITTYTHTVFSFKDEHPSVFNTFCGFAVEQSEDITPGECDMQYVDVVLHHIYNLSGRDDAAYKRILDLLADSLQNPAARSALIVIFVGDQGQGKSEVMSQILQRLFGGPSDDGSLFQKLPDASPVLEASFNSDTAGRKWILVEEMDKGGVACRLSHKLRAWSGGTTEHSRRKYKDARTVDQFAQFIGCSNEVDGGMVRYDDPDDRRYLVMRAHAEARRGEYTDRVFACIEHPRFPVELYKFLMTRDLTTYNRKSSPPVTSVMRSIIERPFVVEYIIDKFISNKVPHTVCNCLVGTCSNKYHNEESGTCALTGKDVYAYTPSYTCAVKIPRDALRFDYKLYVEERRQFALNNARASLSLELDTQLKQYKLFQRLLHHVTDSGNAIRETLHGGDRVNAYLFPSIRDMVEVLKSLKYLPEEFVHPLDPSDMVEYLG